MSYACHCIKADTLLELVDRVEDMLRVVFALTSHELKKKQGRKVELEQQ